MTIQNISAFIVLLAVSCALADGTDSLRQSNHYPALPQALTNNAVVSVTTEETEYLISFAGLGEGRTNADTLDVTWVFEASAGEWREANPVPGGVGRLAGGVPVLAVTAVGKNMNRDQRYLGLACRICAELGAHMVKTYYCEGFEELVKSTPVPIVIAGGKKIEEREAIQLAHDAVRDGASGVDMGRNVFQSDCPEGMIRAIRAVVQNDASPDDAYGIYRDAKG